ncbi:hypothetical protein OKW21_005064 [Catalinimonas alkaloidigena]|uniref:DUF4174 domain-containing protein n=1 Tax=Catalinimonas alkaloidigena TaxID=1075417 RepID=UPI0024063479|nr:DUF4174 domain-containing protein [Catalinimonas alkaloidigena]MDF9799801.1 hypothetical protein [Catalinimonas alkaloidigena]
MKIINIYLIIILISMSKPALSQGIQIPGPYHWKNRIILLFSSNHGDKYQQQLEVFNTESAGMKDRDLVVFYIKDNIVESPKGKTYNEKEAERLREQFQIVENAFSVILIGKDGTQKLKQDEVLSTDKLFAVIDAMPMRRREMRQDGNY